MFKIAGGIVLAVVTLKIIDILGFVIFGTEYWLETIKFMVY